MTSEHKRMRDEGVPFVREVGWDGRFPILEAWNEGRQVTSFYDWEEAYKWLQGVLDES